MSGTARSPIVGLLPLPTGTRVSTRCYRVLSCDGRSTSWADPVIRVLVRVILIIVVDILFVALVNVKRLTAPRQFALQGGEVGVRGVVLQLPGHLRLLGLSTAAPHGSTPSHRIRGSPKAGPDDVRHLSWLLRYMGMPRFGTSGYPRHPRASREIARIR